jgi:lipopolysaccharide/colanic/teichoic acid biosynthesis glycosyltransferase
VYALPGRDPERNGKLIKRGFEIAASLVAILLLSPILLLVGAAVKLTSRGPVLFCQERIGRRFRPFRIYKFRTMVQDAPMRGGTITVGDDPRITRVGRLLRKTKIDELPQLVNVLKGDMSLVGPRPETPKYVQQFREDYEEILQVRPGITDLASIEYRHEAAVLGQALDGERAYIESVLPEKIRLAKEYIRHASFWFDVKLLCRTVASLIGDRLSARDEGRGVRGEGQGARTSVAGGLARRSAAAKGRVSQPQGRRRPGCDETIGSSNKQAA